MRNSTTEYNRTVLPCAWLALLFFVAPILPAPPLRAGTGEFRITHEDMVAIHADQAWEDTEPDTIHFRGNFEIRIRDWRISADRATLFGKLDDPERLELGGSPARFEVSHPRGDRMETVRGQAEEIVYDRDSATILFMGSAQLGQGENVLQSTSVEYNLETNRYRARGETGVQINIPIGQ